MNRTHQSADNTPLQIINDFIAAANGDVSIELLAAKYKVSPRVVEHIIGNGFLNKQIN